MAKKTAKETSLPLVISLVFFVLTTITFGVLWYTTYSDQQTKEDAKKKAEQEKVAATGAASDALLEAQALRVLIGVEEEKDKDTLGAQTGKGKEKLNSIVKKYQDAIAKSAGYDDPSKLPDELKVWQLDDKGVAQDPPAKGFLPIISDAINKRNEAQRQAAEERKTYQENVTKIKAAITTMDQIKKKFDEVAAALPEDFKKKLEEARKTYDDRTKQFRDIESKSRDDLTKVTEEKDQSTRLLSKNNQRLTDLQKELATQAKLLMKKQDTFQYDEPQGKILRRLPDKVVEINLGYDALVRPGLTFTVLPGDYPEKGRQSRMRVFRVQDDKGEFKPIERFVEKATIEVIDVLGPKLSRARITNETEEIRDAAGPGDLLYNAVWRKGMADHIALIGIFDLNGDGTDDIQSIVRDLLKMGIPVDAYFDLKTRKWVGQVDVQTRYIIRGESPVVLNANDPKRDDKSKIYSAINSAIETAQLKGGAQAVSYRDFFPRMGYHVNAVSSPERINQAAAPYFQSVTSVVETPPMP
jgi:hypothetical protein